MKKIIKVQESVPNTFEENFKIYLRLKPNNSSQQGKQCIKINGKKKIQLISPYYSTDSEKIYNYDEVLPESTTNDQVFEKTMIVPILNALSGFNSTVFIYGMTGAGKTYTMFGKTIQDGLIGLALQYMFNEINLKADVKTQVLLSFFEIYNQNIRDLLQQNAQNLTIMEDPLRGVTINDLKQISIENSYHGKQLIAEGYQRRAMNATKSNELSSRSHAILQLQIKRFVTQGENVSVLESKFFMIDLAGNQKTGYNEAKRFIQGVNINKSLLTLGKCINILAQQKKNSYVPFRDSKLTRILKQSLGGNSKTVMIACVSSQRKYYQETLNTLKYSSIAKRIKNKGIRNNIKMISKNQLPDQKTYVQVDVQEQTQQKKVAQLLSKLIIAVQDKFNIENLKESLEKVKLDNLYNIKHGINAQQSSIIIPQIQEQICALNTEYHSTIMHAENLYKTLMGEVIVRRNSGDDIHARKHIIKLEKIIKQQQQRIKELESLANKNNIKEEQNNTFNGSIFHETSPKIDQSLISHSHRSQNKKSELVLNHFHTDSMKTIQLQPRQNKRILNSQHEITINLNQTTKNICNNKSKDDFVKRLRQAQKKAKGSAIEDISQIINQQQNYRYDLSPIEQSMLRKLKFFQRERPLHKSHSMGGKNTYIKNGSIRKWTQKF